MCGIIPNSPHTFMKKTFRRIAQAAIATAAAAGLLVGAVFIYSQGATADDSIPTISSVVATPTINGATITWSTNNAASSQVVYGTTTAYGTFSALDANNMTSHSVTLANLASTTLYHFYVISGPTGTTTATSSDMTFTTLMWTPTPTSTPTTTPSDIEGRVTNLETRVSALETWVQWLLNHQGSGTTTTPGGGSGGPASIDQPSSVRAGTNTDFGGHNFGSEEHVSVKLNGTQVATAFTNLEGGFSTGSVTVPNTTGSYTYTFTGLSSGKTASVTITVIP
jgi:hypothetical protein